MSPVFDIHTLSDEFVTGIRRGGHHFLAEESVPHWQSLPPRQLATECRAQDDMLMPFGIEGRIRHAPARHDPNQGQIHAAANPQSTSYESGVCIMYRALPHKLCPDGLYSFYMQYANL